MARTDKKTLEKNRMRVLAYLAERAREDAAQGTSLGSMARALALTESRVRGACRALEDGGLLVVEARFDEDGGQKANRHVLTALGREALQGGIDRAGRPAASRPARARPRPAARGAGGGPCRG